MKADQALEKQDFPSAIAYLKRMEAMRGADPSYVWGNLARVYGIQGDDADYGNALNELEANDPEDAKQVIANFGDPRHSSKSDNSSVK